MCLALRQFELELSKSSRLYARLRRENNPNAIFQDLKAFPDKGVHVLMQPKCAKVVEVRLDDMALVLDHPVDFDPDQPVVCNTNPIPVIHADHDCVWVQSVDGLEPGCTISQLSKIGTDDDLFHTFLHTWKQMWERHSQVPPDRWETILAFARHHLPRQQFSWPPIEETSLSQCVSHKKHTTAGGLDGVSLRDLQAMPYNALSNFVSIYRQAELNGDWPPQIVAGRVACIAKTACPVKALDFRPITVLGLLYRCWSTYQAKFAIKKLDAHLPTGLYGSRPRRYAGQVWSHLLWAIEHAYEQDIPLCGVMADIQKAFNFLPRLVVLECCAIVGLPFPILRAWAGALTIMERRFQINGAMSPPALSNCGLPEGCALSCVGMMVVDMVFHAWMVHFFPLCQPISYVDDWQILLMTPEAMLPAMQCLERFTQALDLLLDKTKTHAWSICKEGRSTMRDQGLDLVSYAKNLGPHVQFTRQHTNKTLVDRINDCQPLWIKLRLSACGYASKVRALRVAAWPRCLHGVAATSISLTHFAALRSSAMRGLGADAAGANPMVQLGIIEKPITDPHCWAITQTIRLTRDCGDPERVEQVMCEIVSGSDAFPSNSITQTLCARLQFLGWHVSASGQLVDMLGCFSLFTVSLAELQYRIDMHWIRVVAAATAHRQCFSGMENCDPGDTRDWLGSLSMPDQAIFRKILNGTHITQDGKMHCQETSVDTCPFCDCSDSRYHRFWECQRFETLRSHVSPETRKAICDLPEVLTCSGWSLMPTTMTEWNQYFVTLPVAAVPLCRFSGDVFLFTDGSCHAQHDIKRRFAARSVVQATCDCAHDLTGSQVLDAGPLPGLLKSAARAEVFAILRALQCAQTHVGRLFLWTDCSSVVRRLNRILAGHDVRPNSSHADLWLEIQIAVQNPKGPTFVAYVAAHQQLEDVHDFFTEWCFRHNSVADRQAVRANFTRDVQFWQLYYRHHSAVEVIYELNRTVQQVQLAISHEVAQAGHTSTD